MTNGRGLVLITGAGRRIGRVIAQQAALAGWDVALHVHTAEAEAQTLAAAITDQGRRAFVVTADLLDPQATQNLIPGLCATAGPLTALVNNASLFDRDTADFDGMRHRRLNYQAPLDLIAALAAQLPPESRGSVVNLLDGTPIPPPLSYYGASKEALRTQTESLARHYAPQLRINAVEPGPTLKNERESVAHFDRLVAGSLTGRASTPVEIAEAVLFLLANNAITGTILPVNGGLFLTDIFPKA